MAGKKYYAVARGTETGIYESWDEARERVTGVAGAKYKSFYDLRDALDYLEQHGAAVPAKYAKQRTPKEDIPTGAVVMYTDGGAINNPGPGGYGVVLSRDGERHELSGGYNHTTNNRMEIMACITGLSALQTPSRVILYSDSKYVVNAVNEGWLQNWQRRQWRRGGRVVDNADLWQKLIPLLQKHDIEFRWVKGHGGKTENERCDHLAKTAARQENLPDDPGYHKGPDLFG